MNYLHNMVARCDVDNVNDANDFRISTELQLLILLALPKTGLSCPEAITTLLPRIDWSTFLKLVNYHRVALAVHRNLGAIDVSSISPSFTDTLEKAAKQQATTNSLQWLLVQSINRVMGNAGIPYRFIKGMQLSHLLYQDIGWRFSRDIDILINPTQLAESERCLSELGFVSEYSTLPLNGLGTRLRKSLQKDVHFYHANGVIVELHTRLNDSKCRFNSVMSPLFLQLPSQCTHQELVYLCWHASRTYCHRLKWLVDIAAYAAKLQQVSPNWQAHAETFARETGVLPHYQTMLGLVTICYPNLLGQSIDLDSANQKSIQLILSKWQFSELPKRATFLNVLGFMRLSTNLSDRLKSGIYVLYYPNPSDIALLNKLPCPFNYIYLSGLPIVKMARYSRRLLTKVLNSVPRIC